MENLFLIERFDRTGSNSLYTNLHESQYITQVSNSYRAIEESRKKNEAEFDI